MMLNIGFSHKFPGPPLYETSCAKTQFTQHSRFVAPSLSPVSSGQGAAHCCTKTKEARLEDCPDFVQAWKGLYWPGFVVESLTPYGALCLDNELNVAILIKIRFTGFVQNHIMYGVLCSSILFHARLWSAHMSVRGGGSVWHPITQNLIAPHAVHYISNTLWSSARGTTAGNKLISFPE